jgi:hypothetical protein
MLLFQQSSMFFSVRSNYKRMHQIYDAQNVSRDFSGVSSNCFQNPEIPEDINHLTKLCEMKFRPL